MGHQLSMCLELPNKSKVLSDPPSQKVEQTQEQSIVWWRTFRTGSWSGLKGINKLQAKVIKNRKVWDTVVAKRKLKRHDNSRNGVDGILNRPNPGSHEDTRWQLGLWINWTWLMIMCQYWFIGCNKQNLGLEDANNRGNQAWTIWELSTQFFCKPKSALKIVY